MNCRSPKYNGICYPVAHIARGVLTALLTPLLLLCLVACGDDKLTALDDDATIVAFGDSLTAGIGVSPDAAYPAVLEALTGRHVINAGVSGETTAEGLTRLSGVLDESNADLMILLEGGNDILRNQPLSDAKRNLHAMIASAKQKNMQVVLIGVPKKSLFSSSAEIYSELADEHDIVLQDDIISSLLKKPSMKSDSVHFNEAGYRALAEAIQALLEKHGAL